jgi:hypothetical protein
MADCFGRAAILETAKAAMDLPILLVTSRAIRFFAQQRGAIG